MDTRRTIYVITEETRCPLYNSGEEFLLDGVALTTPRAKPACLILAKALRKVMVEDDDANGSARHDQAVRECGGCVGMVRFELKQEKGYATLPMQLLAATKRRERHEHFEELIRALRGTELFASLPDNDMEDLACILRVHEYAEGEVILARGEAGARLCILLTGQVEVVGEQGGRLSLLDSGEVFGEMSLLSGTPVSTTVRAVTPCRLAELHSKDFRHLLTRYLALQMFFYRLMAERLSESNRQRAQAKSVGMSGLLQEVGLLELLQLCHTARKSGRLQLDFPEGNAELLFHDGDLVAARHGALQGREAFFDLIAESEGFFSYSSGLSAEEQTLPPLGGFVAMLMQGMQRRDEATAPADSHSR